VCFLDSAIYTEHYYLNNPLSHPQNPLLGTFVGVACTPRTFIVTLGLRVTFGFGVLVGVTDGVRVGVNVIVGSGVGVCVGTGVHVGSGTGVLVGGTYTVLCCGICCIAPSPLHSG